MTTKATTAAMSEVLDTSIGMKGVVTMIPAALILMAEAVWAGVVMVGLAQIGGR